MTSRQAELPSLNTSNSEFRAILIHPSNDRDKILACSLATISLDEEIEYEALSYVWGEPEPQHIILVNDVEYSITPNLAKALEAFRNDGIVLRPLFVDAICIDQSDPDEKATQVALMGRIYRQASIVRAWLGEAPDGGADRALHILRLLNQERALTDIIVEGRAVVSQDLSCIANFWNAEYWNRAWIVQEFTLPKHVIVHWGKYHTSRDDLPLFEGGSSNSNINQFHRLLRARAGFEREINLVLNAFSYQGYGAIMSLVPSSWTKLFQAAGIEDDGEITFDMATWEDLRRQRASLRHDHVYAYLGLLDSDVTDELPIDYTMDVTTLFTTSTLALLSKRYRNPALLNWAVGQQENPERIPTWSLRFGNVQWVGSIMKFIAAASPDSDGPQFSLTDGNILSLKGYYLDEITATTRTNTDIVMNLDNAFSLSANEFISMNDAIRELHIRLRIALGMSSTQDNSHYIPGDTTEHAYWTMLIHDLRPPLIPTTRVSNFLSPSIIAACREWLVQKSSSFHNDDPESFRYVLAYHNLLFAQRPVGHVFRTKSGYLGITNRDDTVSIGDHVLLLAGAKMPFILRLAQDTSSASSRRVYELVTAAYVHGLMARNVYPSSATDEMPATDWTRDVHPHNKVVDGRWHEVLIA